MLAVVFALADVAVAGAVCEKRFVGGRVNPIKGFREHLD
jgi:hypothetical protein